MLDPEQVAAAIDPLLAPTQEDLASVKVFPLIPALKKDVTETIDTALSWEQLTASDFNFAIVRPLVTKYARLRNMAVVYACFVVRSYFLAQADVNLAFTMIMQSRANFCELLAMKFMSRFASNYLKLVAVLTTAWSPLAGASPAVIEDVKYVISKHDLQTAQTALELAIATKAKTFLSTPVTQNIINDIYSGNVVFSLHTTRSILADNYKPRAIQIYDVRKAPFLNHYRLRVPRYGAILEFLDYVLLILAFVLCLSNPDKSQVSFWELVFIVLTSAHVLEQYTAAVEHGWYIYIANMWNVFHFSFIVIFLAYFGLRMKGLHTHNLELSSVAFDILACGGCILFPRLVFFAVANHVIILSLQAMIVQFVVFIGTVMVCFSGFLFTLWVLARDTTIPHDHKPWTFKSLTWYCIQIWLGNTYTTLDQAGSFHPIFGPLLVTIFAVFSNTLLVTKELRAEQVDLVPFLISILSNTVARIGSNAPQEYLFQFAISTIEGVKNEALFSYRPPFNILAFVILKPASWFISPRALHSANVFLIRVTSLPQLIAIAVYERHLKSGQKLRQSSKDAAHALFHSLPRHIKNMPLLEALVGSPHNDIYDAILDLEMNEDSDIFAEFEDEDHLSSNYSRSNSVTRDVYNAQGVGADSVNPQPRSPTCARRRTRTLSTPQAIRNASTQRRAPQRDRIHSPLVLGTSTQDPKFTSEGYGSMVFEAPTLAENERTLPPRILTTLSNGSSSGVMSPLARFFTNRNSFAPSETEQTVVALSAETSASVKKVEVLLDELRELPMHGLRDEMRELQERQVRIENLLLTLTRNMSNDSSGHNVS